MSLEFLCERILGRLKRSRRNSKSLGCGGFIVSAEVGVWTLGFVVCYKEETLEIPGFEKSSWSRAPRALGSQWS